MAESETEYTFAFFPYLKTSEPVYYRGTLVRSTDDSRGLPPDAVPHLEALRTMFFLRDHLRILKASYAFHSSSEGVSIAEFTRHILEFRALVCYIYSSPHPHSLEPFLRYEHASVYFLQPKRIHEAMLVNDHNVEVLPEAKSYELDSTHHTAGYEGRLNNESYFWVAPTSRMFPPNPGMWLNISQDLSADFGIRSQRGSTDWLLIDLFMTKAGSSRLADKVLTALTWYNRSIGLDIDESVALVNLAIAFESLLDFHERDKITAWFREAVGLLAGDVPRLDSWLTQFYQARSCIVHKGHSESLMFVADDDAKKATQRPELQYRSLVSYGRLVFQLCVAAVLTGARIAEKMGLSSLLVTNQERLERICLELSRQGAPPKDRIIAASQYVRDIETYRFVDEKGLTVEQLLGTVRRMIEQYLTLDPNESPELIGKMTRFVGVGRSDHYAALSLLRELDENLESVSVSKPRWDGDIGAIVASLVHSVWHYAWMNYFQLERLRTQEPVEQPRPNAQPDCEHPPPN